MLTPDDGDEEFAYPVLRRATLEVADGDRVEQGQQLQVGSVDPKEVLRVRGVREVQKHLVSGVQDVYRSQGVPIHDKHIEVIVRQMLRKVTVVDHGETTLLPGELVHIVDVTNGARLETYTIAGERGSGILGINGAAARLVHPGDVVILIGYGQMETAEAREHKPHVVFVDADNKVLATGFDPAEALPGSGLERGDLAQR